MNNDQVINIRVAKDFLARLDKHIESINNGDALGRKLTKSSFMRAAAESAMKKAEGDSDE